MYTLARHRAHLCRRFSLLLRPSSGSGCRTPDPEEGLNGQPKHPRRCALCLANVYIDSNYTILRNILRGSKGSSLLWIVWLEQALLATDRYCIGSRFVVECPSEQTWMNHFNYVVVDPINIMHDCMLYASFIPWHWRRPTSRNVSHLYKYLNLAVYRRKKTVVRIVRLKYCLKRIFQNFTNQVMKIFLLFNIC